MSGIRPLASGVSPYADGVAHGLLRLQLCADCAAHQTLGRIACSRCGGMSLSWVDAAGRGTVYAVTVVTRAPSDEFRSLAPYTLVLVDLEEGSRVMAHGVPGLAIGDKVSACGFVHAGKPLIRFQRRNALT